MNGQKIALLSNVNMDFVIRMLQKHVEIYRAEGYGNELGILTNPSSSYHVFEPDITFLVMDLMELLEHELDKETAKRRIEDWFAVVDSQLKPGKIYYISDAYLWGPELAVIWDVGRKAALEGIWQKKLEELCESHGNVRIFPYHHMVEVLGEKNTFSLKMWYLGKILLSNEAQRNLCELITEKVAEEMRTPKKVLILDLDHTLWGGLAGEANHTPVELSEEHVGLAYKNLQRVILQMQRQGVLLAIVSKNNEADALEILEKHPHMVLRPECFAAKRINWAPKHENIKEIGDELNLGTDSFVFWDDNPTERQLIQEMLPMVTVPEFPDRPEALAAAMATIYRQYFAAPSATKEDLDRTKQYAANAERKRLQGASGSFEEYLKELHMTALRVKPEKYMERLCQMMNKTNQFNLTTQRYSQGQIVALLEDVRKRVYLYQVSDRFGDNGVVAAIVVDCGGSTPVVTDFVMSCRVMGKNIENGLLEDVEEDLRGKGYEYLRGIYIPTAKNMPVAGLYDRLGYKRVGEDPGKRVEYELCLANRPNRMYYVTIKIEDDREGA